MDHRENIFSAYNIISKLSNDIIVKNFIIGTKILTRFFLNDNEIFNLNNKNEKANVAVNIYNSYDGTTPFGIDFSIWRKICSNGMFGWSRESRVKHLHTQSIDPEKMVKEIGEAIVIAKDKYQVLYNQLFSLPIIAGEEFEKEGFTDKLIKKARELYPVERNLSGGVNNAWVQLQAFTRAITHNEKMNEFGKIDTTTQIVKFFQAQLVKA